MALRLISVSRRFGSFTALDSVSLHVRSGDCYGFLGHNGAGKTTSMRVALGLEAADSGRVIVDGFDAAEHPREARARMGGLIETPGFHGHMSGAGNLVLLARLQGFDGAAAKAEAARLLAVVGLAATGEKPVRNYSQGMKQRLGIAQALLGSPKVVLLDEPMNGLDPEGIEEMRRLLRRLTREEGMTVLLSSHQLSEIAGVCNRIGILRQGRMLIEEETSKLLAAEEGRYALATGDDAEAARILDSMGIPVKPHAVGGLEVSLAARRPGDVARELVQRGADLRTWAPRPPSLEEIYLRFAQGGETQRAKTGEAPVVREPERLAPPRPVLRVVAHEFRRWMSTAAVPVTLTLPALLAIGSVWSRHGDLARDMKDVDAGRLASAGNVTAFEAFAGSMQASLPLVVTLVAALASQSLAGELSRGTLRNVLLRPVRRFDAVSGKSIAVLVAALLSLAVAVAGGYAAAAHWFEWKDVGEILPNGAVFVMQGGEAARMWPEMGRTLLLVLPVLAAFAGIGMFAGSLPRSGAAGLALALGGVALLTLLIVPGTAFGFAGWLPAAHVPWPGLGDQSVVRLFLDTTQVVSNPRDPHAGLHVIVPLVWAAATFAGAAVVLKRRSVR